METKERIIKMIEIGFPLSILSKEIGVHYTTLSKWIKNERKISNKLEIKIENGLNVLKEKIKEV